MAEVPNAVDLGTREAAEAHLAELATQHRPDDLAGLAAQITAYLNPDGSYTDEDRARRRGLTLGKQGLDGMSELRALLTPESRARVEAVLAKTAAPGMCNPDDDTPVIDGPACQDAVQRDMRTSAQRNHDGLAPRSPRQESAAIPSWSLECMFEYYARGTTSQYDKIGTTKLV